LLSEFAPTGIHVSRDYMTPNVSRQTLVPEPVFQIATDASVAKSKSAFADEVRDHLAPYDDADYEGFRPTFELISTAAAAAWAEIERRRPS
jgi:hypothetical protein